MKNVLCKNVLCKSSFLVNLIEGAVTVLAVAVSYAFIFEEDKDQDIELGLFVSLVWLLCLLITNLFFKFFGKFRIKETLFFQLVPFVSGATLFIVYQLVLR